MNRLFDMFDADGSGQIDFVEFSMALEMFTSQTPVQKLNFMFQCIDADGNGRLTKEELCKVVRAACLGGALSALLALVTDCVQAQRRKLTPVLIRSSRPVTLTTTGRWIWVRNVAAGFHF